jgi:hypothetical protein
MFHEKRGVTIMLMLENTFCDYSVFSHPSTSTRQPYPPQSYPRIALLLWSSLLSTPSSSISCMYHLGAPTTPFDSPPTPTMLELIHLSCSAIVCHHPWGDSSVRVDPAGRGLAHQPRRRGGSGGGPSPPLISLSLYLPPSLSTDDLLTPVWWTCLCGPLLRCHGGGRQRPRQASMEQHHLRGATSRSGGPPLTR